MLRTDILPNEGKNIILVYRNHPLPSHPYAREAALIGACLEEQSPGAFWMYAGNVFKNQRQIARATDPADQLLIVAKSVAGVSGEKLDSCLKSGRAEASVARDETLAQANAVGVTPTVFINDFRIEGLPSRQDLFSAIEIGRRQSNSAASAATA